MIYQDTPYYLAPGRQDGRGDRSSCCARRCARRASVAIARLVLSSRERMVTIGRARQGMFVRTLRAPNEVRATSTYFDEIPDEPSRTTRCSSSRSADRQKRRGSSRRPIEDRYENALMAMIKENSGKGHRADHRGAARTWQRRQPDRRAEGEPSDRRSRRRRAAARPGGGRAEKPVAKAAAGGGRRAPTKAK